MTKTKRRIDDHNWQFEWIANGRYLRQQVTIRALQDCQFDLEQYLDDKARKELL